jgi:predicted RNA-binding Zn-ribbon protein involved in translation (DUF1610 family)
MINGLTNDIYLTEYPIKEGCFSHSTMEPIVELPEVTSESTTLNQLLEIAQNRLGAETVLEFDQEIVVALECSNCGQKSDVFKRMAGLNESVFVCPNCGDRREMRLTHRIDGAEEFLNRKLAEFDVPPLGIVRARNGDKRAYLELTGDKDSFLKFE